MNTESNRDNTGTNKRLKNKNARCIACRKCYNTGLCLMLWPGFRKPTDRDKAA